MTSIVHTLHTIDSFVTELSRHPNVVSYNDIEDEITRTLFMIKMQIAERDLGSYAVYTDFISHMNASNIISRVNTLRSLVDPNIPPLVVELDSIDSDSFVECFNCKVVNDYEVYNGVTYCGGCSIDMNIATSETVKIDTGNDIEIKTKVVYRPVDHCSQWLEYIQGNGSDCIPNEVIDAIKIRHKSSDTVFITCRMIRQYLKDLKLTKYNQYVVKIKSIITKRTPPMLSDYETSKVKEIFTSVIDCYNRIKIETRKSTPYHPYFIYKIIHLFFYVNASDEKNKLRLRGVLNNIHMQSAATTTNNDTFWKAICKELNFSFYHTAYSE